MSDKINQFPEKNHKISLCIYFLPEIKKNIAILCKLDKVKILYKSSI